MSSVTITVHDDSGEQPDQVVHVANHDYFLLCTGDCYEAGLQA